MVEPAAASLPRLDALLAHDGKDVGTALPTEVWASTSQGTLRCWSEGAKLRLEKATDATAAPADAVLIAFKSAEAEREVVAADGAKALVAATAATDATAATAATAAKKDFLIMFEKIS